MGPDSCVKGVRPSNVNPVSVKPSRSSDTTFCNSFDAQLSLRSCDAVLRSSSSAQELDLCVWPAFLAHKIDLASDKSHAKVCVCHVNDDVRSSRPLKRASGDDLSNPRAQVSRIVTSTSPRGSEDAWTPTGSWSFSPVLRSSALPLTPVGSEGDLTVLQCESPLAQSRAGSFSPQLSLLGEPAGPSFSCVPPPPAAATGRCAPDGGVDLDYNNMPLGLVSGAATPTGCSKDFLFPVSFPSDKDLPEVVAESGV
eukprot:jgi/Botrbrau1/19745/Bobra.0888s0001.1